MKTAPILSDNPHFCLAPWTSLYLLNDGSASPCCHFSNSGEAAATGHLGKQTLAEAWNSPEMRQLRLKMLEGKEPIRNCANCHRIEGVGEKSFRQELFRLHGAHLNSVSQTAPDGSVSPESLVGLYIPTGDRCQLRCRMCGPWASSAWRKELGGPDNRSDVLDAGIQEKLKGAIAASPKLERMLFIGGEPLISPFHYEILDLLLERGMQEKIELYYNSNLFQLGLGRKDVLELWNRFSKVTLYASVDGTHDLFEFVRRGHKWSRFIENLAEIRERCPHVDTYGFITISLCNYLEVPSILRALLDEKIFPINRILFTYAESPQYMNPQNAPKEKKEEAKASYILFMKELLRDYDARDTACLFGSLRVLMTFLEERDGDDKHYQEHLEFNQNRK